MRSGRSSPGAAAAPAWNVPQSDGGHGNNHQPHARSKAAFGDADERDGKVDDEPPAHERISLPRLFSNFSK